MRMTQPCEALATVRRLQEITSQHVTARAAPATVIPNTLLLLLQAYHQD
jgi:hypothetical protein